MICGYEAGCLGYSLYHQLTDHGVKCIILAPTTMGITNTNRVKADRKDAANIARCLAFHTYSAVYVPDSEEKSNKLEDVVFKYARMLEDSYSDELLQEFSNNLKRKIPNYEWLLNAFKNIGWG